MAVRPTRADVISPAQKQTEFFSDFMNSFSTTPVGDQLAKISNERSVNQSLRNLIKTNLGERLFQPDIGSDVNTLLFNPVDPSTSQAIRFYIESVITNNEPRVNLIEVSVQTYFDSPTTGLYNLTSENEIVITIVYNLINNIQPISFSMVLRRVR